MDTPEKEAAEESDAPAKRQSTRVRRESRLGNTDPEKDPWGKGVFIALLIIIPIAVFASLAVLTFVVKDSPDTSAVVTVTRAPDGSTVTTTTYMTPSLTLGAVDPALGKIRGFFIGPLIFLMGSIL